MNYAEQVHRLAFLEAARNLARSGAHRDADSIKAAVECEDGFREVRHWFDDRRFRAQLTRLCEMARAGMTSPRTARGQRRRDLGRIRIVDVNALNQA